MKNDIYKILVIGPSWLGDMIMAQSLFKAIAKKHVNYQIDVLALKWCLPICQRMPEVNKLIEMPINHGELKIKERYRIGKELAKEGYDEAFVIPSSLKSALIPFFAKIPKRTGWLGEMRFGLLNNHKKLDKNRFPSMIEKYVALSNNFQVVENTKEYYPSLAKIENSALLNKYKLSLDKKVIAFAPGAAFGQAKCWPREYYAKLANILLDDFDIWLFGANNDTDATKSINEATGNRCHDLAGKTSLDEVTDLLGMTSGSVCNDSGLMHLSAAAGIPVVAIYGPTPEKFAPPLTDQNATLFTDIECRPCRKSVCPLQHHLCMREVYPEKVHDELMRIIS